MSEDKLLVFCVCEFVSEESFPMVLEFCRAAHKKKKKKSLIQNHSGGPLLERESLACFAN